MSVKETTNRLTSAVANLSNRYAPAIITIIILACFFYYYFSVIVRNNERDLKERKFRSLYQVASNIKSKLETFQEKNAPNFLLRIKRVDEYDSVQLAAVEKETGLKYTVDSSLKSAPQSAFSLYDPLQKQFKFFSGTDGYASVDFRKFLQPLLRSDIFCNYMIAINGSIVYDDLNISESSLQDYISKTLQDDTIAQVEVVPSRNLVKTNIAGKNYWLFSIAFGDKSSIPFTIGGYLADEEYEKERTYIPIYVMLWLVSGVVLVIVIMPLLRIFKMHRSEQLVTMTVSSAFAAVHLLASIIILTTLSTYVYFHVVRNQDEKKLEVLADDIESTLNDEIQASLHMMKAASDELRPMLPLKDILTHKSTPYEILVDTIVGIDTTHITVRKFQSLLYHIVWTDINGMQRIRWTAAATVPEKVNIRDRDYYKAIVDNKMFYNNAGERYFFTDISSWVNGKNFAVISTPREIHIKGDSTGPEIIMVSGNNRLKSVFSPILPMGYSFCVVDKLGKVLFHKDEKRNLNENIAKECSEDVDIEEILRHRTPTFFQAKYSGSNFQFYCKPITGTDYSLLTFKDLQQSWAEDLDVISATSILVLFNLGIVLLAILVIRSLSYNSKKIKTPSLAFTWLKPVSNLKKEYASITCYYLIAMGIQICFIGFLPAIDSLSLLASTFTYTFLMLTATFHQFSIHNNPQKSIFIRPRRIFAGLIAFLCVGIILYALIYRERALWLVGTVIIHAIIYTALTYRWQKITPVLRNLLEKTKTTWLKPGFRNSYTLFVTTLMTATSIIPLLIFYVLCSDEQSKLTTRYLQWDFANQLSATNPNVLNTLKDTLPLSFKLPFHSKFVAGKITGYHNMDIPDMAEDPFTEFYKTIKPSFFHYNLNLELLNSQRESNHEFAWYKTPGSESQALYFNQDSHKLKSDTVEKASFDGWKLSDPQYDRSKNHLLMLITLPNILLMIFLLFCLYAVIRFLIKKVFFEGAAISSYSPGPDLLATINGNLFIYGAPGTNKISVVKNEILKHNSFVDLDFADLAFKTPEHIILEKEAALKTMPKSSRILVLTNIAAWSENPVVTGQKLTVIEYFQSHKIRMILISSKYFESLDIFEYNVDTANPISYTRRWQAVMQSFYNVYNRWTKVEEHNLAPRNEKTLNAFLKESYRILGSTWPTQQLRPYDNYNLDSAKIHAHILNEAEKLIELVRQECSHSAFLAAISEPMIEYASRLSSPGSKNNDGGKPWPAARLISRHFIFVFEKVCDRIESLASNHYLSLWNAITLDEQRTLYDIAIDELVNPLNRKTAARLCEIGLAKPVEGIACYSLMNISFRSFILNHVANNEISNFKKEIAAKGFGSSIQLPLVIVAISAFTFIIITQKEAFTSLISYLGAGFAGITGLLKIISSIPDSKAPGKNS
jgi:hypothetical protein